MARKKLSKGIHFVKVKNCVGIMCERKVKVLANGQWRFLPMKKKKSKRTKSKRR